MSRYIRLTEPTVTMSPDREDHTIGDEIIFVHTDGTESVYRLVEQLNFREATSFSAIELGSYIES